MHILLVGLNFTPEPTGVGKYTGEMTEWLTGHGHSVSVVTAPPYYPFWKISDGYHAWRWRREKIGASPVIRCPLYVPARPSGIKRLVHLASFGASCLPATILSALGSKPDIVAAIVPTIFSAPVALGVARLVGARSWAHMQDLEVDAAFELGILRRAPLRRVALAGERRLLSRFDLVSAISEKMVGRLTEKGIPATKLALFPNWVDVDRITRLAADDSLRRGFGIPEGRVIALYSGSMGEKHGLEVILAAARRLLGSALHIVIAGDGPGKAQLAAAAAHLPNVTLLPLQPAEKLNEFLAAADIHLLPQRADAAELVMPSKLGAMLASGRPVIALAAPDSQIGTMIGQGGCVVPPGDATALALALHDLAQDPARRDRLGRAARAAAMSLAQDKILAQLEIRLSGLAAAGSAAGAQKEMRQDPAGS